MAVSVAVCDIFSVKNSVTLKTGLGLVQSHWIWDLLIVAYEFLLAFHGNYGAILYRLPNVVTYWSKIANFLYPTYSAPSHRGWPRRNLAKVFEDDETRVTGLPYIRWKTCNIMLSRFCIQYRNVMDRRTDWQICYNWHAIKMISVLCIILQNFVKRNNDVHYTTNYCTYICRTVFADDEQCRSVQAIWPLSAHRAQRAAWSQLL